MNYNTRYLKLAATVILSLQLCACSFSKKPDTTQTPSVQNPAPQDPKPVLIEKPDIQDENSQDDDTGYITKTLSNIKKQGAVAREKVNDLIHESEEKIAQLTPYKEQQRLKNIAVGKVEGANRPSSSRALEQFASGGYPGHMPSKYMPSADIYSVSSEEYDQINENSFVRCEQKPVSTFSIDVDTASYSNVRRFITEGTKPPADAVRIEELINYFDYDYAAPEKGAFATHLEVGPSLWNSKNKVVRIGIKGKEMAVSKRPASNLVFLIDVSGSMQSPQKLPLVKQSLRMLVEELGENDQISMVVYAGSAGLVLPPTTGDKKTKILNAIEKLEAGGSTNGSGGIALAYETASEEFIKGGVNRVILATDGDFNVGITDRSELVRLVEKHAKKNIYLSVLGFGMGNYKDGMMETLSNKGNGNYAYIDSQKEARKVMVEQLSGTLVTIAKDVKIQVEFNPNLVAAYRLIGYENRLLKNEDFDDDTKDAGDIGAGHTVTALYEIVPVGEKVDGIDNLKYSKVTSSASSENETSNKAKTNSDELLTLKIRYKKPDADISEKQEFVLKKSEKSFDEASVDFKFASSVALFGMLLRNSEHVKDGDYSTVISTAKRSRGEDNKQYRKDFIEMVQSLKSLNTYRHANLDE